jgi:hypothetical protein
MSDQVDVLQGAQDAIYLKLKPALEAAGYPAGFQSVPQDTQPPFWVVGDMDADPLGDKGGTGKRVTVDVHFVYRGDERRGLLAMMNAAFWALNDQPLDDIDGVTFSGGALWLSDNTATGADGITTAGVSQFEVCAEPA